jgi:hypothetical protein
LDMFDDVQLTNQPCLSSVSNTQYHKRAANMHP